MLNSTVPLSYDLTALPTILREQLAECGTGCWEWQGSRNRGYGRQEWQGRSRYVHTLTYALLVGPVPRGLVLDHLCRNRPCANPAHLEPVPPDINVRRGRRGNPDLPIVLPETAGMAPVSLPVIAGERWRPVLGYEGLYEVSDRARLRSLPRSWAGSRTRGRILKVFTGTNGYQIVTLSAAGKTKTHSVHRLVAQAFYGPCPEGEEVRHLDGDKGNNCAANLAYGPHSVNQQDLVAHGRHGNGSKTRCKHGHEFTPDNTRITYRADGTARQRECLTCEATRYQARLATRRIPSELRCREDATCPVCGAEFTKEWRQMRRVYCSDTCGRIRHNEAQTASYVPIRDLPPEDQARVRGNWRAADARYRVRKRAEGVSV